MDEASRPQSGPVADSERSIERMDLSSPAGEPRKVSTQPQPALDPPTLGTILVIEDDPRIVTTLHRLFTMERYEVKRANNATRGMELFSSAQPDAVILDLMLPDISGREICKLLKQSAPHVPVIILSAISDVADKVLMLEAGADDYVTKPFSPRELLARVQAAIRRSKRPTPQAQANIEDIQIDFASMRASKKGRPIALTAFEFKLLRFFLDNPERVITREELLSAVWGYSGISFTRTVDNQILKLRQKLEDNPADPVHFCTVHGAGYRFVPSAARDSSEHR